MAGFPVWIISFYVFGAIFHLEISMMFFYLRFKSGSENFTKSQLWALSILAFLFLLNAIISGYIAIFYILANNGIAEKAWAFKILESNLVLFTTSLLLAFGLVYPRPISGRLKPSDELNDGTGQDVQVLGSEGDDFQGLRAYKPGDSLQHISWKASSRGQGFYTKDFAATAGPSVFLDWEACPAIDGEHKLSVLCHNILAAHQDHRTFGLKLPDRIIEPDRGEMHKIRCLEALALFSMPAGGL